MEFIKFIGALLAYIAIITVILKAKWKEINEKIEDFYKYLDSDENFEGFVHLKKDEIFVNASKRELWKTPKFCLKLFTVDWISPHKNLAKYSSENNLSKIISGKEIEFRIFSYIRGIRKGLKLLFSCLCCDRNTNSC